MQQLDWCWQRRRNAAAILLLIAAALCIQDLLAPYEHIEEDQKEEHDRSHRFLLQTLDESKLMEMEGYAVPDDLSGEQPRPQDLKQQPINEEDEPAGKEAEATEPLTAYTLQDAILEADVFQFTFAVLVYDPRKDKFIGHYSKNLLMKPSFNKLKTSIKDLSYLLRKTYPERFTRDSPEFVVAIGSGDYPHVELGRLPHTDGVAPVLQFGSVFQNKTLYPNMISMPMPGLHLDCFTEWAGFGKVCKGLRPVMNGAPHGEQPFGEELDLEWDNLIPQIIWRGTDWGYLPTLMRPGSVQPLNNRIENAVKISLSGYSDKRDKMMAATQALREHYSELRPRWKGALLTAEAELEAEDEEVPWANIKFATYVNGGRHPTKGSKQYKTYDDVDISTGQSMDTPNLVRYKYQIDIGGGGGTTWTGTSTKLGMPGLLFHHITPTKDYFYDRLKPWEHYVPVSPDLQDLKEKFIWAENHPEQAKRIADQSTEFMRQWASPEGFGQLYEELLVEPLGRVIEAYQPVSNTNPKTTWSDLIGNKMVPVLECNGMMTNTSACEIIGGAVVKKWQRRGRYPTG